MLYVFLIIFQILLHGVEYKFNDFVFDFDDGWTQSKGTDPNSVFRIENNDSYIEFIKMEDELSDFYLNSMISKQKDLLFARGLKTSSIKIASIHGVSKAYYFSYSDTKENIISLFTYGGMSFTLMTRGISEESFKKFIFSFRKEGEKIEMPIAKPKPKHKPKLIAKKEKKQQEIEQNVDFIHITDTDVSTMSQSSLTVSQSTDSMPIEVSSDIVPKENITEEFISTTITSEGKSIISNIVEYLEESKNKKAIIERKPLNKFFSLSLIVFYFIMVFLAKMKFLSYSNPKAKPYPKDMPPDFLFPIIVTRVRMLEETLYQIITRTNQFLSANYNHSYIKFTNMGIGFIIALHLLWSLSEFIKVGLFQSIILSLPFGSYIFSFIEIPFVIMIVYGFYLKIKEEKSLVIKDSQMNLITTTLPESNGFIVKNSQGRVVLKIKKIGSIFKREWACYDEDEKEILVIRDDYPIVWIATKILGNTFLKARSYYSIYFEGNKRIGFLFLNPNSFDGYQIHYDFDYFRLINPVHLTSIFLYIISTEKEKNLIFF